MTGVRLETQVQQSLSVDIMFVKQLVFIIGVLSPLGLGLVQQLKNRSAPYAGAAMRGMIQYAKSKPLKSKPTARVLLPP
jgi:hypothetical protein